MKAVVTHKKPDQTGGASSGEFIKSHILSWLCILGVGQLTCSCGRVDELAKQQLIADKELFDIKLQFTEVNDEISQFNKDNAAIIETTSEKASMSPADYDRSIQEVEQRINKLQSEKEKILKQLEEAQRFLSAQQSRGRH